MASTGWAAALLVSLLLAGLLLHGGPALQGQRPVLRLGFAAEQPAREGLITGLHNVSSQAAEAAQGLAAQAAELRVELGELRQQVVAVRTACAPAEGGAGGAGEAAALREEVAGLSARLEEAQRQAEHQQAEKEKRPAAGVLEKENEALRQQAEAALGDMRLAAEADRLQLAAQLKAMPDIVERRRQEIAAAPQRGVVVSAGWGSHLANAFVNLHVLRHHLKSELPAAVTYWGQAERIPEATRRFFQERVSNVAFVDTSTFPYPPHHRPLDRKHTFGFVEGWKLKVFGIYMAPFQEILFLDSDCMPLMDPSALFEAPEYREHGSLFFPDRWSTPPRDEAHQLYKHFGLHNPWDPSDKQAWPPQTDSAQFLLNRARHPEVLEWLLFLNSHDEFTYRMAFGDKDTFRASFDLAGERGSFFQSPHRLSQALAHEGDAFKWRGYLQLAPNGSATFLHRSWYTKYNPGDDTLRPITHATVGLSDERNRANENMYDWMPDQIEVVPPDKCTLEPHDFVGGLERCGFRDSDTSLPIPTLPIPPGSTLAAAAAAADAAFKDLRAAIAAEPGLWP